MINSTDDYTTNQQALFASTASINKPEIRQSINQHQEEIILYNFNPALAIVAHQINEQNNNSSKKVKITITLRKQDGVSLTATISSLLFSGVGVDGQTMNKQHMVIGSMFYSSVSLKFLNMCELFKMVQSTLSNQMVALSSNFYQRINYNNLHAVYGTLNFVDAIGIDKIYIVYEDESYATEQATQIMDLSGSYNITIQEFFKMQELTGMSSAEYDPIVASFCKGIQEKVKQQHTRFIQIVTFQHQQVTRELKKYEIIDTNQLIFLGESTTIDNDNKVPGVIRIFPQERTFNDENSPSPTLADKITALQKSVNEPYFSSQGTLLLDEHAYQSYDHTQHLLLCIESTLTNQTDSTEITTYLNSANYTTDLMTQIKTIEQTGKGVQRRISADGNVRDIAFVFVMSDKDHKDVPVLFMKITDYQKSVTTSWIDNEVPFPSKAVQEEEGLTDLDKFKTQGKRSPDYFLKCEIGYYFNIQMDSCQLCQIGRFNPTPNQTSCNLCPYGEYSDVNGETECKICSKGKYNDELGNRQCKECSIYGQTNLDGMKECTNCMANSKTLFNASTQKNDCKCDAMQQSVFDEQNDKSCRNVPDGSISYGGKQESLIQSMKNQQIAQDDPYKPYLCLDNRCEFNKSYIFSDEEKCSGEFVGFICNRCDTGQYNDKNNCYECRTPELTMILIIIAINLLAVFFMAMAYSRSVKDDIRLAKTTNVQKLMLFFVQIIAAIEFKQIRILEGANTQGAYMNLNWKFNLECVQYDVNYQAYHQLYLAIPIVIAILIVLFYFIAMKAFKCFLKFNYVVRTLILQIDFIQLGLCLEAFGIFKCQLSNINDSKDVFFWAWSIDTSIECFTAKHLNSIPYQILMIMVYAIIPLITQQQLSIKILKLQCNEQNFFKQKGLIIIQRPSKQQQCVLFPLFKIVFTLMKVFGSLLGSNWLQQSFIATLILIQRNYNSKNSPYKFNNNSWNLVLLIILLFTILLGTVDRFDDKCYNLTIASQRTEEECDNNVVMFQMLFNQAFMATFVSFMARQSYVFVNVVKERKKLDDRQIASILKHLTFTTDSNIKITQRALHALPTVDRVKLNVCLTELSNIINNLYEVDKEESLSRGRASTFELPKLKNFSVDNEYLCVHSVDDQLRYALPAKELSMEDKTANFILRKGLNK